MPGTNKGRALLLQELCCIATAVEQACHARTACVNCTAAPAVRQYAPIKAVNAKALCKFVIAGTKCSRLAHRKIGVYCEKHKS